MTGTRMKIASFNINNIRKRLPNLLEWLRQAKPDVVCLQELKTADAEFPAAAIRGAGYEAVWKGQKSWNGVAILARRAQLARSTGSVRHPRASRPSAPDRGRACDARPDHTSGQTYRSQLLPVVIDFRSTQKTDTRSGAVSKRWANKGALCCKDLKNLRPGMA